MAKLDIAERLRASITYDRETGRFYWRQRRGSAVAGQEAGCVNALGYVVIRFDRRLELAHRLAWLHVHGEWPPEEIDHINGNPADNRMDNLRLASHAENGRNVRKHSDNASGFKGVHLHKQTGRWRARIKINGVSKSLGLHDSAQSAHIAYCRAAEVFHGDFARFG